jgi:hypothetical protein
MSGDCRRSDCGKHATVTIVNDDRYALVARDLADALIRYARSRRYEDQKDVAHAQFALCQLRREELQDEPAPS